MLTHKPSVYFVTGSSSGIGRHIADTLSNHGHKVLYHGKSNRKIDLPKNCEYIYGDLSKEDIAENIFNYVKKKYEIINLICCAGRSHLHPTKDNPLSFEMNDMLKVLDNIFTCTVLICQKFAQEFIKRKNGKIIIIGGDVVDNPNKNSEMCSYAISKAAVHQYAVYLSNLLRNHNVSVNVVAPTGVFKNNESDELKKTLFRKAFKQEIANVVYFLCNQDNFMSGQILRVNGGRSSYLEP